MRKILSNKIVHILIPVLLLAVIVLLLFMSGNKRTDSEGTSRIAGESSQDITIQAPLDSQTISKETNSAISTDSQLTLDVAGETSTDSQNSSSVVKKSAKPVTEKQPIQSNNSGGITIGDPTSSQAKYNCNTPNHHCDGPETHAFITNLELQGCELCGSHSCPSFYALDQWGHTCFDVTKCPKYDITKDPVHYCQECLKKCGDGTNGTCVQFVNDCNCPNCGKWVPTRTCHTCE